MSSGGAPRRLGIREVVDSTAAARACTAGASVSNPVPGVATPPGAIAFTRIPCGASSSAAFLVNPQAPCLDGS